MMETLQLDVSDIYYKNLQADSDLIINRGGTSSTKTFSLAQLFITYLLTQKDKKYLVARKYTPSLRLTVMADFIELLKKYGVWDKGHFHKTEKTFYYPPTSSIINFQGLDDEQKLKGVNFNYVWLNEADEFTYNEFNQLYLRLRRKTPPEEPNKIFLDFNPSDAYCWIRTKLEDKQKGVVIHSTYLDNPFLDEATVAKIKDLQENDSQFWKIYGLGEYTSIQGLIFENYQIVPNMPNHFDWCVYGLDFGFSNDPTALVKVAYFHGELWIEEKLYSTGYTNQDLIKHLKGMKIARNTEIFADSAEPKSIEEIYRAGFNIKPAKKGADSINYGVQLLKNYKINVVHTSNNIIKEIRSYKWKEDKNGNSLNKPIDIFNHAIDAIRYAATMKFSRPSGLKILKSR